MIDDDTTINALALLEGQVLLFFRHLQTMKSDAVLAAAMAYEVADAWQHYHGRGSGILPHCTPGQLMIARCPRG